MIKRSFWVWGLLSPLAVQAASFEWADGAVQGSFDSQLTYGAAWRTDGPENRPSDAGATNFDDNGDIVSNRIRGVHELELTWRNFGAFVRGNYYYDQTNDQKNLAKAGLGIDRERANDRAVADAKLLDAYVHGTVGPLTLRAGKQVLSWGESTFLAGGINEANTFDISQLRSPGTELKEALQPNEAFSAQWMVTEGLSLEGFVLFDFDEVILDPAGTFWNTNPALSDGGTRLGPFSRTKDDLARDSGQWGVSAHFFAPGLGSGFDFGAYFERLHSHNPYLNINPAAGTYNLLYPEEIEIYGLSFSTIVGPWAVSGEWSHRPDLPVQGGLGVIGEMKQDQVQASFQLQKIPRFLDYVPLIPTADNSSLIVEIAKGWTNDVPTGAATPIDDYWGFSANFTMDYLRAIAGVINLQPRLAFAWDVEGVSGESAPNFREDEKAFTVGLGWDYLIKLRGGLSYTRNIHGNERSWVEANVSYQF